MLKARYKPYTPEDYGGVTFWGVDQPEGMLHLVRDGGIYLPILNDLKNNGCEFLITVAMYNEGIAEMKATMKGVCENLKPFMQAGVPREKIAVVIVADGITPFMKPYGN
jgi:hypothetical protein